MSTPSDLLAAYDAQLRARTLDPVPAGVTVEREGPLVRACGLFGRGFVVYRSLEGLSSEEVDELIAAQVRFFAARNEAFEWKHHGHDTPADLPRRLVAAGFVPEEQETVVAADVGAIAGPVRLPEGVSLREVSERVDLDRIARLQEQVWGDGDYEWLAGSLASEHAAGPDALSIFVAEAGEEVVSAAWVRFERGTEFATLWGGATLASWRGRGIYRALVGHRANLAAERGFRYLEVDASDDSRPILERLGFVALTSTTPYVWRPPA